MRFPSTYIHEHGVGDAIMVESRWSEAERDAFEVMYYSLNNRQTDALRGLIEATPRYAKVVHRYLAYPTQRIPGAISMMADYGILLRKTFTGSSFLKTKIADLPFELPKRFDFVQAHTSLNTTRVRGRT